MKLQRLGLALTLLLLSACASAPLPPVVPVKDLSVLAGTYTGTVKETNEFDRSARLIVLVTQDGSATTTVERALK